MNLVKEFSLRSLITMAVIGVVVGWVITKHVEHDIIESAKQRTPEYVAEALRTALSQKDPSTPSIVIYEEFSRKILDLAAMSKIVRIKVWDKDRTIIWSDKKDLIGLQVPGHQALEDALKGKVATSLTKKKKRKKEYKYEDEYGYLMELYIPVRIEDAGEIVAVFELYQDLDPLFRRVYHEKNELWIALALGFLIFYIVTLGIVRNAAERIQNLSEDVAERKVLTRKLEVDITKRKHTEMELMNSREELRNLSAYLQSAREEERIAIAREIHDELGQILTAMKMRLTELNGELPENDVSLMEKTDKIADLIETCIQTVQRISSHLRPSILDNLGIIPALKRHAKEFKSHTGIECEVSFNIDDLELDMDRSTVIFRIFQEVLTNAARHANATNIEAKLVRKGENLLLTIKDNGRGITKKEMLSSKSFGIIGIRERVGFIGGTVNIDGSDGTTVKVNIPFPKDDEFSRRDIFHI